jgi:hypothetical protein
MWELHIGMFRTMHGSKNEYRLTAANGQLYLKLFRHCQMWKTGIFSYFSIGNGSKRIALCVDKRWGRYSKSVPKQSVIFLI